MSDYSGWMTLFAIGAALVAIILALELTLAALERSRTRRARRWDAWRNRWH